MVRRKKEGHKLSDTKDMEIWRDEFKEMTLEQHDEKLKALGLDDDEIEEFNENYDPKTATDLVEFDESEAEILEEEFGGPEDSKETAKKPTNKK